MPRTKIVTHGERNTSRGGGGIDLPWGSSGDPTNQT